MEMDLLGGLGDSNLYKLVSLFVKKGKCFASLFLNNNFFCLLK